MADTPAEPSAETAAEWVARLAGELGIDALTLQSQASVLAIAREVAHGAERKYAPLASFIAGRYVERAASAGDDVDEALRDVSAAVARLLGDRPATS